MKFLPYFFAGLLLIVFTSCGPTAQEAADYNDAIVAQQKAVLESFIELDNAIGNFVPEEMDVAYDATNKTLDGAIQKIDEMGSFDEDDNFKNTALKHFGVIKEILSNEYRMLMEIFRLPPEEYNQEKKQSADSIQSIINKKNNESLKEFKKVQKEFAEKYSIILE